MPPWLLPRDSSSQGEIKPSCSDVPLWRTDSFLTRQTVGSSSPTHVSLTKTRNPCALIPTSIFGTVLEANENNLYRVFLFPAGLLSRCFWIESQTALFLTGLKNKQNSAQTDVSQILLVNADGSVFMKCKHSWWIVMINITVDGLIKLNKNIMWRLFLRYVIRIFWTSG